MIPFKILLIYGTRPINSKSAYSVARLTGDLADYLRDISNNYLITKVCPTDSAIAPSKDVIPVQLRRLEYRIFSRLKFIGVDTSKYWAYKAIKRVASEKPDLIIACTTSVASQAKSIFKGIPVFYWVHSLPRLTEELQFYKSIDKIDALVVPTYKIYSKLWSLYERNRLQAPVWIIPNWVNTDLFYCQSNEEKYRLRSKSRIETDALVVIHVGGQERNKGFQILRLAMLSLQINQRLVLLSIGNPPSEIGDETHGNLSIRRMGRVPPKELNDLYALADIGCVPSVWFENAPLVLLEMMSTGLCVIASNAGGIPELLQDGEEGLLVQYPNDVSSWAEAIQFAIEDPSARRKFGANAIERVKQTNDKAVSLSKWEKLVSLFLRKTD